MRTSSPPRAAARRLEVSVDLTLDPNLGSTARLILCALAIDQVGPLVHPTDRELADRHGVSERTVRGALAAGEHAGWVRRANWSELLDWYPELAAKVPRVCRPRRFIVLLWLHRGREPATPIRQSPAPSRAPTGNASPELPAPDCRLLAHAPVSNLSEERTREIRTTFVPPLSPQTHPALARMMAVAAERESSPAYVPTPEWKPPAYTGGLVGRSAASRRVQVEEKLAACLGPESAAAIDALVLWLMTECRERLDNEITRAHWSRKIPHHLQTADGFAWVVDLIMLAPKKPKPGPWLSACLSRGQPGTEKNRPPEPHSNVPRGPAKRIPFNGHPSRPSIHGG